LSEQKNILLAIILSGLVLVGWQLLFGVPRVEKQAAPQQTQATRGMPPTPGLPVIASGSAATRQAALAASPRIPIETPRLAGSIALKGGHIDDLSLVHYRRTMNPNSPPVVLLSPVGSPHPFYAEFGWSAATGTGTRAWPRHELATAGIRGLEHRPSGDAHLR
jgi:YidC/Oxa1 family membrane protein insertase